MNASELRVGNWVRHRGTNGKVQATYFEGVELSDTYGLNEWNPVMAEVEPIPLTEEILFKCGFQVMESSSAKEFYIGINPVTKDWLFSLVWLERPDLIKAPNAPFYRNGAHTIYHVHQLQNLYFALTGEELKIEL